MYLDHKIVEFVIENGAYLNKGKQTPIQLLCARYEFNKMKMLIENDANMNFQVNGFQFFFMGIFEQRRKSEENCERLHIFIKKELI